MRVRIGTIRTLIREAIRSIHGPGAEKSDREEMTHLGKMDMGSEDEHENDMGEQWSDDNITLSFEDLYGPVPPTGEDPHVTLDPYSNGWSVLPTSRP